MHADTSSIRIRPPGTEEHHAAPSRLQVLLLLQSSTALHLLERPACPLQQQTKEAREMCMAPLLPLLPLQPARRS